MWLRVSVSLVTELEVAKDRPYLRVQNNRKKSISFDSYNKGVCPVSIKWLDHWYIMHLVIENHTALMFEYVHNQLQEFKFCTTID